MISKPPTLQNVLTNAMSKLEYILNWCCMMTLLLSRFYQSKFSIKVQITFRQNCQPILVWTI